MAEGAILKVALLARAGDAREQLKRAITDLGAELVVEADPNDLAPGSLASSGAQAVLVSVEPAVEAALDRLDDELLSPSINVMYDEAATTAKLEGWDLNRWARHLAAKLVGRDVLPPGGEPAAHEEAALHLVPGIPASPASLAGDAQIADYAVEIDASAADVPSGERLGDALASSSPIGSEAVEAPPTPAAWAAARAAEGDPDALGLDAEALQQALAAGAAEAEDAAAVDEDIDLRGLELTDDAVDDEPRRPAGPSVSLLAAKEIDLGDGSAMEVEEVNLTDAELAAFGESGAFGFKAAPEAPAEAIDDDALALDPELAKLAASFDENLESLSFEAVPDDPLDIDEPAEGLRPGFDRTAEVAASADAASLMAEPPPVPDFDFAEGAYIAPETPAPAPLPDGSNLRLAGADEAPPVAPASPRREADFSALGAFELAPMDDAPAVAPPPAPAAVPAPSLDVDHLSLAPLHEDEAEGVEAVATVLVLSGIGGPDAVRQLVRALPAGFPRAVLLRQNLDGGRHDRFVDQIAKISRLPVALAEPTETPPARQVRVLPEGIEAAGALSFPKAGGVAALVAAVAAQDGAVVVLSGADEAAIEPLKQALADGARVLVQDPAACFDGKVAQALRDAGAPALAAADIAARLDGWFPA